MKGAAAPRRAHKTSVLQLEPDARWVSSARPTDLPPPPRGDASRGTGTFRLGEPAAFSWLSGYRAARTQTEPRRSSESPKPHASSSWVDLSRVESTSPARSPSQLPAVRACVAAESAAEEYCGGFPGWGGRRGAQQPGSGRRGGRARPLSLLPPRLI